MKRERTKYSGVYYRMQKRLNSGMLEKVYYIIYRQGGRGSKLIEEPVGRESKGMTAAKAAHVRSDRVRGVDLPNTERRKAQMAILEAEAMRPTLDRLWDMYRESLPNRKRWDTDTSRYGLYLKEPFGRKVPSELVSLDLERLRLKLVKAGRSQATVKSVLELLRRLVRFGAKRGLYPMPDVSRLHFSLPKVDNARTENMTPEQMAAYLNALDEEQDKTAAAFLRMALTTGMRKGALMGLQWDDIDFEFGFITLRGDIAKKGRTERIPLSSSARLILGDIPRTGSAYVFPGRDGGPRKEFKKIAQRVKEKAGLPEDFRPLHGLRHTFASWMASSGEVDLYTLQRLLTHNSPQMTQRYAHLADAALQRAASVADELFSAKQRQQRARHSKLPGKRSA